MGAGMGALIVWDVLWRFRWLLAGVVAALGVWTLWLWLGHVEAQRDAARAELATAVEANADTAATLNLVLEEKDRSEAALQARAARKQAEADRLGKLVKHILEQPNENDCPVSDSVNAAIDGGLR